MPANRIAVLHAALHDTRLGWAAKAVLAAMLFAFEDDERITVNRLVTLSGRDRNATKQQMKVLLLNNYIEKVAEEHNDGAVRVHYIVRGLQSDE